MAQTTESVLGRCGWATYAGTAGSFTVATAIAGYVAVPRYINGMSSIGSMAVGGASIALAYTSGLGSVAWGPFQMGAPLAINFYNFAPPDTAGANKALVLNVGGTAGTSWYAIAFEYVKTTGTTS